MKRLFLYVLFCSLFMAFTASAVERYVDLNNPTPGAPYTRWTNAATDIQSAVDISHDGDVIVVSNGTYNVGGRVFSGCSLTNRVCVTNSITLRSVNGPEVTVIEGAGPTGDSAVRCVLLATNALLQGFTITSGYCLNDGQGFSYTPESLAEVEVNGGGVLVAGGSVVSNCLITKNVGYYYGAGAYVLSGTLVDCVLFENQMERFDGGGVYINNGVISGCIVSNNYSIDDGGGISVWAEPELGQIAVVTNCLICDNTSKDEGGGVLVLGEALLRNCIIRNNWSGGPGGGVCGYNETVVVTDCLIKDNWAEGDGGGVLGGTVSNCVIQGNTAFLNNGGGLMEGHAVNCIFCGNASENGGAAFQSTVDNCLIYDNEAYSAGGGVYSGTICNSTICDNSASVGGGVFEGQLFNSVVYYNSVSNIVDVSTVAASCSPDLVSGQYSNITNSPGFAGRDSDNYRLSSSSPCLDSGINGYAPVDFDLDGNSRFSGQVDIGAFEYSGDLADSDGDGLSDTAELHYNSDPSNPDSDGDGFVDGWEVALGWDPTYSDFAVSSYIASNSSVFGYYTEESIGDFSMGEAMLSVSNGVAILQLQLMSSTNLVNWTNVGSSVGWSIPVTNNKAYFRIHAEP